MALSWERFERVGELVARVGGSPDGVFALPDVLSRWRPAWWDDAACRERPDVDFFADDPGPAREVCKRCGVRRECGDWAAALDVSCGVFGGLDQAERGEVIGMDEQEKRRLNALVRSRAVKELTHRHREEFRAIYAAEKEAAGLGGRVQKRRTA
jgi:hypothetical protein